MNRRRLLLQNEYTNVYVVTAESTSMTLEMDWDGSTVDYLTVTQLTAPVATKSNIQFIGGATYPSLVGQAIGHKTNGTSDFYSGVLSYTVSSGRITMTCARVTYFIEGNEYLVVVNRKATT